MARTDEHSPEDAAVLSDNVGSALLVVLETLRPDERLAFVLHDTFAVPFAEIAPILNKVARRHQDVGEQGSSRRARRARTGLSAARAERCRRHCAAWSTLARGCRTRSCRRRAGDHVVESRRKTHQRHGLHRRRRSDGCDHVDPRSAPPRGHDAPGAADNGLASHHSDRGVAPALHAS